MLNGNLSTRPFYNERLANLLIAGVAAVALLLTAYNAWTLVTLSAQRREYKARIARDHAEAARLRAAAAAIEQRVDVRALSTLAGSAREANELIDQRTFSWTTFFGVIERTLPFDVRLTTVTPRVERGTFKVVMGVVARDLNDVDAFCDALQANGQFYDVAPTDQHSQDDGSIAATVEASYAIATAPPAPPAPAGRPTATRPPRS